MQNIHRYIHITSSNITSSNINGTYTEYHILCMYHCESDERYIGKLQIKLDWIKGMLAVAMAQLLKGRLKIWISLVLGQMVAILPCF